MGVEVTTPADHLGDIINDLQQRPRDHHQPGAARQQHGARRRSAAVGDVRLLDGRPQPEPGPSQLLDGAAAIRPGAEGCRRVLRGVRLLEVNRTQNCAS